MRRKGGVIEFPLLTDPADEIEHRRLRWIERPGNMLRACVAYAIFSMLLVAFLCFSTVPVYESSERIPSPVFAPLGHP